MSNLIHVLETALPVFLALALGMLCRKKGLLTREGVGALKNIVVNITLPAVMFSAFATAEYSLDSLRVPAVIFVICLLALGLGTLACRAFRLPGRLTPFLFTGFEAGMLGYALFALLFKGTGSARFAMIDLGQVLFVFTVYKALLNGKGGLRSALREAVSSPTLWAIAAGLIVGASGLYAALASCGVSGVLDSVAGFLSAPTSAVILLTIGFDLEPAKIRLGRISKIVALRVLIMAAMLGAALLINRTLLGGAMHEGALILMFILPPPYVLPVFADEADERADISSALSLLTILSLLLFAVLSALMH